MFVSKHPFWCQEVCVTLAWQRTRLSQWICENGKYPAADLIAWVCLTVTAPISAYG